MPRERSHRGERVVTFASCDLIGSAEVTDVLHDEHEVVGLEVVGAEVDLGCSQRRRAARSR